MLNKEYSKYINNVNNRLSHMYDNVKNWTRNVDLFQKDFIVIPMNERYIVIV